MSVYQRTDVLDLDPEDRLCFLKLVSRFLAQGQGVGITTLGSGELRVRFLTQDARASALSEIMHRGRGEFRLHVASLGELSFDFVIIQERVLLNSGKSVVWGHKLLLKK